MDLVRVLADRVLPGPQNIPATLVVADRVVILNHGKLVANMRTADCPPATAVGLLLTRRETCR